MTYTIKNSTVPLCEDYDVIVCGGGPSGCTAAAAAAREGAKTLLIESSGMLGGMGTKGMVNTWTPVSDKVRIIYGGMAEGIFRKLKSFMPHVPEEKWNWLPIDYERLKVIYDDLVLNSGADLLLHTFVAQVEMKDERNIDTIIVSNKAGLTAYRAKVYIDCTGDADLYAWAGQEYDFGDEETGELQPGTMCFALANLPKTDYLASKERHGGHHRGLIRKIIADGKYPQIHGDHHCPKQMAENVFTFNSGHVYDLDGTDPKSLTMGCVRGRKLAWAIKDSFSEYDEVYRNSYMVATAPSVGLRETRRIHGDYSFTVEDYLRRATFPDEIARGNYYIDIHDREEDSAGGTDILYEHYGEGESYGVPYRCLCPKGLDNVLVAGRTICSDRLSNGTLRIMPMCLCTGEAAGMAAKFACEKNEINIHTIDTQRLRKRLTEEGGYLPKLDTDTF